ncbi:tumor necrosis factor receptor superfamily member 14-like isoform X1 [Alosa sapidissima]|uniref:tumor necrosis factor receptor superfamily member 14-like isoform X1 n=2 Tax=Alosa sapidissima TaxID=34773 RepID=UPI001C07F295|nr:tumor necrosis factor receptor superfamily member 14-like isoform X1 [Alosa sapidissima]XP_041953762.1 tumor necrosis factor receptor superfamily member 14-like isoform X1 [Alosa sapidissima]XP_041953763.1 tumor necrosis factor receptor superfamily member 14-like isoform X1 [Alosa sapidissima]XP_041953765.1 tumor necrosis factor receptor superfamily member 14-like isoform X1 [Alosa sapidissima]XP_041953766.1 tumor necrosis factor receptor superfamily member 14-like isoform X1 [Alosa sapidiss
MWRFLTALTTVVCLPGSCGICMGFCGPAEYEVQEECCPMCGPGYYVYNHCTELTSTSCAPCPSSTYNEAQSGLVSCRSCTVCDSTAGLRVKRACSSISDTLCEPLEGHYCTDPIKDGCRGAVEHTKCSPGQYIKHNGSASSDIVCGDCVGDTYSDGTFTSCRPHTQCGSGYQLIKEGTSSSDAECKNYLIEVITPVLATVGLLTLIAVAVVLIFKRNQDSKKRQGVDNHTAQYRNDRSSTNVLLHQKSDDETKKM